MKNIILSIREVEPGLVTACHKLSEKLGYKLEGLVIIPVDFINNPKAVNDTSGFFKSLIIDFDNPSDIKQKLEPYLDRILTVNCRFETAIQQYIKTIPFLPESVSAPTVESLQSCTEKSLMRDKLRDFDKSLIPKYTIIESFNISKQNLSEIVSEMVFPMVVKPSGLYSSLLVTKCIDFESLFTILNNTLSIIGDIYEKEGGTGSPKVLIEEFIKGDMYSIDAYVKPNGEVVCLPPVRVITSHDVGLEGFYCYESIVPSNLESNEVVLANKAATSAVLAIGLRSCTAHIELYNTDNGWKIIELAPRIGGHREDLYREAYGIDHYYNDLSSRLNVDLGLPKTENQNYALSMNVYPDKEGQIVSYEGLDKIAALDSYVYAVPHIPIGATAKFAHNGGTFAVDILLSATTSSGVLEDASSARKFLRINVG